MTTPDTPWSPLSTERLLFRRPTPDDLAAAVEIHTDPATNLHNPARAAVTASSTAAKLDEMIAHWDAHGFGVWVVAERVAPADPLAPAERVATAEPLAPLIGFTGLSHRAVAGRPALNLYYRYRPSVWGRGYATEGARLAVSRAALLLPGLPVVAYTTPSNVGSARTALAAGLLRRPDLDVAHPTHTDTYYALGW